MQSRSNLQGRPCGIQTFVYKTIFSPREPWIPQQQHNRVGVAMLHKPQGLLMLHCMTMRSEEGSFFQGTKEKFFTLPMRTTAHKELLGSRYHVLVSHMSTPFQTQMEVVVGETFAESDLLYSCHPKHYFNIDTHNWQDFFL